MRNLPLAALVLSATTCQAPPMMMNPADDYLIRGDVRTFEIQYTARVKDIPAGTRMLRVWLPVPQSSPVQTIRSVEVGAPHRITTETKYGNRMAYFEIPQPPATWETRMTFVCDRTEIKTDLSRLSDRSESPADWSVYLGNDRLTYVDERIRKMAMEVTKGKATSLEKAKAIYDYTVSIMVYDKTHQGWGRGDVSHACDVKKGNCTDFHALFQALCRAVGIPAGFEIGLYLPYEKGPASDLGGYHCWAFFRVPGRTWVPVDCSEASRVASLREYFFGNQTNNRVTLSMGRDLVLNPPQAGEPLNYFLNPYAEADGVPVTAEKTWSFKDLNP